MTEQLCAPLSGVKVLELGTMISAPYCSRLLADLGAEVIKVESPVGDHTRDVPPRFEGMSTTFRLLNRNKRSVILDLKDSDDAETFARLTREADVLIENLRPGGLERLGFSSEKLRAGNGELVYLSISGFGQSGPWADRPAYDIIAQAMSGLMAVTGPAEGPPARVGISIGDVLPGVLGAFAVVAALLRRQRTRRGARIDLAMVDALLAGLESVGMRALHDSGPLVPTGTDHAISAPYGSFAAADGQFVLAVANDALFSKLAGVLGRPHWIDDPRFVSDELRGAHREELRKEIEAALADWSVDEALRRLSSAGVPCAPILDPREALTGEYARARGVTDLEADGFTTLGMGFQLDDYRPPMNQAPRHGEHTARPHFEEDEPKDASSL
ncbi:CaiB/BaiF CoA transferase family protein [Segeticoccus rhizosphaerae]|uniref:CaiB/BaiF CoA transferase family protein n=1 Tax=Segeticoccus rhizosphaerae TaxID=1104777 RepID=UPI0012640EDD|nr:CoA transferase [Segeticoccus rhizosphaerae]